MRPLAAAILALAALSPAGALADEYANVHTVAVVVAIPDAVAIRQMSMLSFSEGSAEFIPTTDLTQLVRREVSTALARRFTVVDAGVDGVALGRLDGEARWDAIDRIVRSGRPPVDAYVFVLPTWTSYGRIEWPGIGMDVPGASEGGATDAEIYTNYIVISYDAHTGDRIDYGEAELAGGGLFSGVHPMLDCRFDFWPSPHGMTMTQQQTVTAETVASLEESLPVALESAGLPTGTGHAVRFHSGDAMATGACTRP